MFPLLDGEKITGVLPLSGENSKFPEDRYVFMATNLGTVKKTPLSDFSNPRKAGIIAVDLDEGDFLIGAALTDGKHDVRLFPIQAKRCALMKTMCVRWAALRAVCACFCC